MKKLLIFSILVMFATFAYADLDDDLVGVYNMSSRFAAIGQDLTELNSLTYNPGFHNDAVTCNAGQLHDTGDFYGGLLGTSFTITYWVNLTTGTGTKYMTTSFKTGPTSDRFYLNQVDDDYSYTTGGGDTGLFKVAVPLSTWHMVTARVNGTQIYLYFDGALQVEDNGDITPSGWSQDYTICGFTETPTNEFQGVIDEFYIYNRTLSDTEITELYNGGSGLFYPFAAADTTPPTFSNFANNATNTTVLTDIVLFNISVQDDIELDTCLFSHNQSGTPTNVTVQKITGTADVCNASISITLDGGTVCGQFWINDTNGNINVTNQSCFNILAGNNVNRLVIWDREMNESTINLTSKGDIFLRNLYYSGSLIEQSKPLIISPQLAYIELMAFEFDTLNNLHNTGPSECKIGGGLDTPCLVKYLVLGMQYQENMLNLLSRQQLEIKRLEKDNLVLANEIHKIDIRFKILETNITAITRELRNETNSTTKPKL